jgi:SNF2 family DNA or RNA helicase
MIHVNYNHKALVAPFRQDLANLFPNAKPLVLHGQNLIVMPHGLDETRLLRNLGFDVPSPILSQYDWCGGSPYNAQRLTAAMLTTSPRAYCLNGMGTGKTKAALWAWDFLRKNTLAGKLLVVAPLSTLNFTWAREVFNTLPHRKVAVLHGTRAQRLRALASDAEIFVINHDGVSTIIENLLLQNDLTHLIIDELASFRNGTAIRTKVMRSLAAHMGWVWGLTGTPTPRAPTDAWAQATVVTPATTPKYFTHFRDEVMVRITQFQWFPKPDALDKVHALMHPSVRFTLDDIVELPEGVELPVDIEMGAKQKQIYQAMKLKAYAQIQASEITAMNAGAVLSKLLQISCGWVYTRDKKTIALDNDARLDRLVEDLDAVENKAIVFVPYIHALGGIGTRLLKENFDFAVVSGATPQGERSRLFATFQQTNKIRVLIAHPKVMAHGLTLTAADTIIWFSPMPDLEIFEQANARIRRIGQKHKQLILMYQATDAEKRMYAKLRAKQRVQTMLLDMFKEETSKQT